MPAFETKNFGSVEYTPEMVLEFPRGIPAFDHEVRFLALQPSTGGPVVFLQSLHDPDLAFVTVAARAIQPGYTVHLTDEELHLLGLRNVPTDEDILCLAIVTPWEDGSTTANLMSPIVIHQSQRRAIQSIQSESGYPHQHPVRLTEVSCS